MPEPQPYSPEEEQTLLNLRATYVDMSWKDFTKIYNILLNRNRTEEALKKRHSILMLRKREEEENARREASFLLSLNDSFASQSSISSDDLYLTQTANILQNRYAQ